MSMPELVMYTRPGCGLCERMAEEIRASTGGARLKLIDIDGNEDLEARFGDRVPVLFVGESELCFGRLDHDLLQEALKDFR